MSVPALVLVHRCNQVTWMIAWWAVVISGTVSVIIPAWCTSSLMVSISTLENQLIGATQEGTHIGIKSIEHTYTSRFEMKARERPPWPRTRQQQWWQQQHDCWDGISTRTHASISMNQLDDSWWVYVRQPAGRFKLDWFTRLANAYGAAFQIPLVRCLEKAYQCTYICAYA